MNIELFGVTLTSVINWIRKVPSFAFRKMRVGLYVDKQDRLLICFYIELIIIMIEI